MSSERLLVSQKEICSIDIIDGKDKAVPVDAISPYGGYDLCKTVHSNIQG